MSERWRLIEGDSLAVLPALSAGSVDAVVTDPPYGLEFMGKEWDSFSGRSVSQDGEYKRHNATTFWNGKHGVAIAEGRRGAEAAQRWHQRWAAALLPAVRPGGYLLAFGGTRTHHRLMCAVEDAGWEIRDTIMWVYGSGFPKGKGCLKPAWESIVLARRPGPKVLPLGIDECRVPTGDSTRLTISSATSWSGGWNQDGHYHTGTDAGRYPANLIHDGSDEVLEAFARAGERKDAGLVNPSPRGPMGGRTTGYFKGTGPPFCYGDSGTAARFFYCCKASKKDRGEGNTHATVKPTKLMEYLVRLACPEGGLVLDPFAGSGTTGVACLRTGRRFLGVELGPEYCAIARRRLGAEAAQPQLFPPQAPAEAQGELFERGD